MSDKEFLSKTAISETKQESVVTPEEIEEWYGHGCYRVTRFLRVRSHHGYYRSHHRYYRRHYSSCNRRYGGYGGHHG